MQGNLFFYFQEFVFVERYFFQNENSHSEYKRLQEATEESFEEKVLSAENRILEYEALHNIHQGLNPLCKGDGFINWLSSLKKYSKNLPENDLADACKIKLERTYTEIDDPDQKETP